MTYRIAKSIKEKDIDCEDAKGLTWNEYTIDKAYATYKKSHPDCIIVKIEEENLKDLEINNLTLQKVVIDVINNKIIVHCLDKNTYKKSYYLKLDESQFLNKNFKDKIIYIMENGYKYIE